MVLKWLQWSNFQFYLQVANYHQANSTLGNKHFYKPFVSSLIQTSQKYLISQDKLVSTNNAHTVQSVQSFQWNSVQWLLKGSKTKSTCCSTYFPLYHLQACGSERCGSNCHKLLPGWQNRRMMIGSFIKLSPEFKDFSFTLQLIMSLFTVP